MGLTPEVTPSIDPGGRQQAIQALGAAHRFTPEQLEANRAGRLDPAQIEAGLRRGRVDVRFGWIMLVLALALLLAGVALAFFPRALKDLDFTFALPEKTATIFATTLFGFVLALLPFTFGFGALRHGRKVVAIFAAGRAERIEGPLRKFLVRRRRLGTLHVYAIGEKRLQVHNGFETSTDGASYRAYYVPQLDELLSIEPV